MKHDKAVLAVDLAQMAILQGLINERVDRIDANRRKSANTGVGPEDAIESALVNLREMLRRVTVRQFLVTPTV